MKTATLFACGLALSLPTPPLAAQEAAAPEVGAVTGLPLEDPVVDAIWAIPDEEMQVMALLDELSNGIGPRLSSSRKLTEACEWARDRFAEFGLADPRLVEWGSFPVGFDRGPSFARMVQPRKRELVSMTRAWTAGTDGPVRGMAMRMPRDEAGLEAIRGSLAGAWIIASGSGSRPAFDDEGDSLAARFGRMCDEEGIAGVVLPGPQSNLLRTGGSYDVDPADLPTRVTVYLRRDQFREVWQMLDQDLAVELEIDHDNRFSPEPVALYNVLAEIPGTDLADQLVIVGGHIDSWDGARGAQDNGTGTATTMEAARILMKTIQEQGLAPRRTIRFMLWSGEEQGLLGSRAYIQQNPEENERISAVLVHDGGTNATAGINTPPDMLDMFTEAFAPVVAASADAEDEDLRFRLREVGRLPYGVGSDHDSYLGAGIPGFFWEQSGRTNYTYIHHTQHDTIAEVVPEYQRFSARVIASGAWRIANMEPMVPRGNLPQQRGGNRKALGVFLAEDGVTIDSVSDGGLAKKAGIVKGDRLLSIGDAKVDSRGSLRRAIRGAGDRAKVTWQSGETVKAAIFDWKESKTEPAQP